jgi:hypothetical protein
MSKYSCRIIHSKEIAVPLAGIGGIKTYYCADPDHISADNSRANLSGQLPHMVWHANDNELAVSTLYHI